MSTKKWVFVFCLIFLLSVGVNTFAETLHAVSDAGFSGKANWSETYEAYGYTVNVNVDFEIPYRCFY